MKERYSWGDVFHKGKEGCSIFSGGRTHGPILPRAKVYFKKCAVFAGIRTVPGRIAKQETIENFSQYLAFNPDEKNLKVLAMILDQFDHTSTGKAAVKQKKTICTGR